MGHGWHQVLGLEHRGQQQQQKQKQLSHDDDGGGAPWWLKTHLHTEIHHHTLWVGEAGGSFTPFVE